jgi:fucose permease
VRFLLLFIIYLAFISLGLPDALLGSAWPLMRLSLGAGAHFAGYISMICAAGTVLSSVLSARVIRRFGTPVVTLASVILTAAALTGISFSFSPYIICLFAVPLGVGAGSIDAALNNYVALRFKARHMNWLHCFWGIGASAGPLVMAAFLSSGVWQSGYRTIAALQWGMALVLLLSMPLWKREGAGAGVENTGLREKSSLSPLGLLRVPGLKSALAAFFCYCALEIVTGLWGTSYLVAVRGIPGERAARWIAFFYFGITLGRFASGFLTAFICNRNMIRLGQALAAFGIGLLIFGAAEAALLPAFFVIGLGCAPVYPALLHETPANFGAERSQAAMGLQMASAYIGTTVMPPVFGRIAANTGFEIFPFFIGLILIVKIIMVESVNRKSGFKGRA